MHLKKSLRINCNNSKYLPTAVPSSFLLSFIVSLSTELDTGLRIVLSIETDFLSFAAISEFIFSLFQTSTGAQPFILYGNEFDINVYFMVSPQFSFKTIPKATQDSIFLAVEALSIGCFIVLCLMHWQSSFRFIWCKLPFSLEVTPFEPTNIRHRKQFCCYLLALIEHFKEKVQLSLNFLKNA